MSFGCPSEFIYSMIDRHGIEGDVLSDEQSPKVDKMIEELKSWGFRHLRRSYKHLTPCEYGQMIIETVTAR
jgi:hypothetical protein